MNVHRDVPIGPLTTYRVGGSAEWFVAVDGEEDLVAASELVRREHLAVLVVGKGSNLLVADAGFDGVAVVLGEEFGKVEIDGVSVTGPGTIYRLQFTAAATNAYTQLTLGPGTSFYDGGPRVYGVVKRAVVVNDQIVIRPMMYLALSYDHRIVDGKGAVTFLVRVKEALEDPRRLLMDL